MRHPKLFLLLAALFFSNTLAGKVCSLMGVWYDSHSVPNSQLMFRVEDVPGLELSAFALTPNLQWGTGSVRYNASTSSVDIFLDSGEHVSGTLDNNCTVISWRVPLGAVWIRTPDVQQVHVVFMNHLDVGYASFIGNILNEYFNVYFPRAVRLAGEAEALQWNETFVYTTHPWLISLYLDCPPHLVLNGIHVQCPTDSELAEFVSAIRKGHIVWHAGPMNMQIELMNSAILEAGLKLSATLDERFGKKTTVLSQRDVPGMTICALPILNLYGIRAVSVGVNPGTAPPAVPKIFRWKFQDQASVLAFWHAGGYPLNPGSNLVQAGGISIQDCTIAPGTEQALCFAFRTDNTGPPTSLEEIDTIYQILREEFPYAKVFASTLDNFVDSIATTSTLDILPTVEGEIGDTWIQGIAADPRKMAEYRAAAKGLQDCVSSDDCSFALSDSMLLNATRFLVKLPEHTWGLPGIGDNGNWTNAQFEKARSRSMYTSNEASWVEQRTFLNLTLDASKGHPLYNYISKELAEILPQSPDLSNFKIVTPPSQIFSLFDGQVLLGFNTSTGAINNLTHISRSGTTFMHATESSPLGLFTYHTYNETDFDYMASIYNYFGNAGFSKPNVTDSAHPESKTWFPKLAGLYQSTADPNTFLSHLVLANVTAQSYYGAPSEVWVSVTISLVPSFPYSLSMEYEFNLLGKGPTRLPEATMVSFYPNPQGSIHGWECMLGKVGGNAQIVTNLDSVVLNGSHYQHAVEYVSLIPPSPPATSREDPPPPVPLKQVMLTSQDVPLVCPIVGDGWTPTPFPVPLATTPNAKVVGVAFNVHNNIWNTNYPLYYPFLAEDQNIKARFRVSFVVE